MAPSRLRIVMRLVPLLTRLEGSTLVAAAFATTRYNSAAFLNSLGNNSSNRGRRTSTSTTPATQGSTATGSSSSSSTSKGTFQRRWPRRAIAGNAAGGWTTAAIQAFSTSTDDGGGTTSPLPPPPAPAVPCGLSMDDARESLKSLFGHDSFRDGQVHGRVVGWDTGRQFLWNVMTS